MAMLRKPSLPLPKGYFGTTELSDEQRAKFRALVRTRLARTLADEHAFVHSDNRQIDAAQWRLVKRKHQLRIFRRRATALTGAEDTNRPSMLSVGRMEGSIEDVLYGSYSKSHDELRAMIAFAGKTTKDCTVLHTLELATPEDPFHYLGVHWLYSQLPASTIVKPRDWCVLNALGIERDAQGNRFGYVVVQSVDLAQCPPFDRRAVVRGRVQLSFIFRELVPGIVEVFSQALFDPAGELIQRFSTSMTSSVLAGVFRLARCAEAKKLTILALRHVRGKRMDPIERLAAACAQCRRASGYFSSLKLCGVCSATVCVQCSVRKPVFIGPAHAVYNVPCCHQCITHARSMDVRPADPSCSIVAEQHLSPDQFSTLESASSPHDSTPRIGGGALGADDDDDDDGVDGFASRRRLHLHGGDGDEHRDTTDSADDLSELDVNLYRFSDESGISEDDVEKIIAALANERAPERAPEADDGLDASAKSELEPVAPPPQQPSSSNSSGGDAMAPEQLEIYRKILALQSAANETFSLTQANNEMMRSLR